MKKILIALVLIFSVNAVHAADYNKGWYETFLKGLKSKVGKNLMSKRQVSAVAAVRGTKQGGDARALYWKGGVSDAAAKKLDGERAQLADAIQPAADGDAAGARAALEKFIKTNPDSVLLPEAKEALEKLPAAEAQPEGGKQPAGTAAPAPEKPADKPAN
ncbi:MAG TPA: hypothetical protein DCZ92_05445 [Elusimicrobia bacterium]|nr:hypothetical protein [Elusimicrobiota bacterium]